MPSHFPFHISQLLLMIHAHLRLSPSWTPKSWGVSKIGVNVIVDFRINETLQTGAVRKPHLPGGESSAIHRRRTLFLSLISEQTPDELRYYKLNCVTPIGIM